ncbi:MAG: hypothetical protein Kow00109_25670 [Acidobacteriota bacterium]
MTSRRQRRLAAAIGAYLVLGAAWILVSDRLVTVVSPTAQVAQFLQSIKGLLFVLFTAAFFTVWIHDLLRRQESAEAALREERRRYQLLLDNLPGAVLRAELQEERRQVFEFLSDGTVELTGYPPAALIHNRIIAFSNLILPDHRDRVEKELAEAWRADKAFDLRFPIRHADGSTRWVWERGNVFRDEDGRRWLEGFLLDVTREQEQAAQTKAQWQQLTAINELLTTILQNSPVMTVLVGDDGKIRWVNREFESTFGWDLAEATGRTWKEVMHADPTLDAGGSSLFEASPGRWVPLTSSTREGRKVITEWMHSSLSDGSRILIGVDLTTEIQAKRLQQRLFEHSIDLMAVLDSEGRFRELNPAWFKVLGFAETELEGKSFLEVLPERRREEGRRALERLQHGEIVEHLEIPFYRPDGNRRFVAWNLIPVAEDNVIIAIGRDMTRQRRLEEQFHHAQKMESIGRLAGGIAHDFNNILTVIMAHAELALMRGGDQGSQTKALQEILHASERAAALTRQLLLFSRREQGEARVLDLNRHLWQMESILRRVIGEDIRISFQLAEVPVPIRIDPSQLEQVVMNLVVNARDAMPRGGRLTVTTDRQSFPPGDPELPAGLAPGEYCLLAVRDTGIGIPQEILPHIFDPFFTTKARGKGTGLGLSTVYGIVHQAGGTILVSSEPGKGTVFTILVPLAQEQESVSPGPHSNGGRRLKPGTVLLVEDDPAVMGVSKRLLEELEFRVLTAETAEQARELFFSRAAEIDLLITDVILPKGTGPDLARELQSRRPDLPVLFVSGYTGEALDLRGVKIEAGQAFLQKPFNREALAEKLLDLQAHGSLAG